ncbi:MAG: hypothetical protein ACHQJ6_00375 [Candidatus Berkiellales bacterium]
MRNLNQKELSLIGGGFSFANILLNAEIVGGLLMTLDSFHRRYEDFRMEKSLPWAFFGMMVGAGFGTVIEILGVLDRKVSG